MPLREALGTRTLWRDETTGQPTLTVTLIPEEAKDKALTLKPLTRVDVFRMIKRRARMASLPASTCCRTFRATGITAHPQNGGTIEKAQRIAAHESPRTTKLYDRTKDEIALEEVERIVI